MRWRTLSKLGILKAFNEYRDEYYYNFPWFYDIEKNTLATAPQPQQIEQARPRDSDAYDELNARYKRERMRIDAISQQHAHELAEKNKVIDTQREENDLLRNQLESQREFLELMRTEDEPMLENSVDIQSLYGKRFLFVGQIREFNSELRRAFPDSKFMESDTDDIKSLKVDGVVLLIRNMSHSMYYKVRQTGCLAELPMIYCNSRSINNIFQAMLTGMAGAA